MRSWLSAVAAIFLSNTRGMSMSNLMTLEEFAEFVNTPLNTVRFWRQSGSYGPKFARIGRRVMVRRSDAEAWVQSQFEGDE
jgi:hypothetical protein